MNTTDLSRLLHEVADRAAAFRDGLDERPVAPRLTPEEAYAALAGPLPDGPADPATVVRRLAVAAEPGLTGMPGPRFFGFVIGGTLPAALAADWLTSAWDQNTAFSAATPAAAAVEEVAAGWLLDLLGLPATASVGLVTGGQLANVTCLAVARQAVLARVGWDLPSEGLTGAPPVHVVVGAERHDTVDLALRLLGIGTSAVVPIDVDDQGRMRPDRLAVALHGLSGPIIVCAQAGNVNTGAVDPLRAVVGAAHEAGAWVHVDGAFGLWAAASPGLRHLVDGAAEADSWATDGHKWLNVPYDCGFAIVADPDAHRAAMGIAASYLPTPGARRDPVDFVPELSRRGRGFATYAALASLGRSGVTDLVDRCCGLARRFAEQLAAAQGVEILNEVALNQVLVRFLDPAGGDHDAFTRAVVRAVQEEGTCWMGTSVWQGRTAMRISVSNWQTTASDVDRSIAAILQVRDLAATRAEPTKAH